MDSIEICQELDKTWIEYFLLLESYQQQRKRTNFLINNGFLELAHSKYIMGPNKITRYQYDKRMQATTCFEWLTSDLSEEGKWLMTLNNTADSIISDSNSVNCSVDSLPVRKRAPRLTDAMPESTEISSNYVDKLHDTQGDEVQLTSFVSATESVARQARRDPVNWFGVLVPAPLKNAQSSFQQAVIELTACANLRRKLDVVHAHLKLLQFKKTTFNSVNN